MQKRKWVQITWLLLLTMTLLISGCTSSTGGSGEQTQEAAQSNTAGVAETNTDNGNKENAETGEEGQTRIVETVSGKIEIPMHPQRVIVDWNVGHVLALGITPIGMPYSLLDYGKFLRDDIPESVKDIGNHGEVSLELMAELEPDLIITWGAKNDELYSKIAPTIVFNTEQYGSMEEEITALGEYLNRQKEAVEWNEQFDQRLQAVRAKVQAVVPENTTFTLVDYNWDNGVLVVGNTANRGGKALYELLGLKPNDKVRTDIIEKEGSDGVVSWEVFGEYVGDYLLELTDEAAKPERMEEVWSRLDAVQNNRRIELDLRKYFSADPYTAIKQAEEMADLIVAKVNETETKQ